VRTRQAYRRAGAPLKRGQPLRLVRQRNAPPRPWHFAPPDAHGNGTSKEVRPVANQEGGTGKSTIAVNVAAAMGERGLRALVVDVDPQADATTMLGIDPDAQAHTLYDVFVGSCELPGAIAPEVVPGVDVAAGTERMGDVELTLADEMMRERYLADALAGHVDDYDLVLIDCPLNPWAADRQRVLRSMRGARDRSSP
jgi:Mrp family chromosome partitioning ATPase